MMNKSIALWMLGSFAVGCTSTTVIHSRPEGAKLYMDNVYKGTTSYTQKDMRIVGSKTPLRLTKAGYEPFTTNLCKDEKADVGAIVGGCFFLFPILWTEGYLPEHTYELTPVSPPAGQ